MIGEDPEIGAEMSAIDFVLEKNFAFGIESGMRTIDSFDWQVVRDHVTALFLEVVEQVEGEMIHYVGMKNRKKNDFFAN